VSFQNQRTYPSACLPAAWLPACLPDCLPACVLVSQTAFFSWPTPGAAASPYTRRQHLAQVATGERNAIREETLSQTAPGDKLYREGVKMPVRKRKKGLLCIKCTYTGHTIYCILYTQETWKSCSFTENREERLRQWTCCHTWLPRRRPRPCTHNYGSSKLEFVKY
jgi:hypothetical protein